LDCSFRSKLVRARHHAGLVLEVTLALALALALAGCTSANIHMAVDGGGGGGGVSAGTGGSSLDADHADSSDTSPGAGGQSGAGGVAGGTGGHGTGGITGTGTGGSGTGGITGTGGVVGTGGNVVGQDGGDDGLPDAPIDAPTGIVPNAFGQLVITEIMADTTAVSDDVGEWFEIYNPSATDAYDLYRCALFDSSNTHIVTRHLIVAPMAFVTLARFADISGGFVPDYDYNPSLCPDTCVGTCPTGCPTVKFSNSGDLVGVKCDTTVIDNVDFTVWPVTKGRSFSLDPRRYDATGNDVQANWCAGTVVYNQTTGASGGTDYGSPGVTNPLCPFD
jgi:hypothetical protein